MKITNLLLICLCMLANDVNASQARHYLNSVDEAYRDITNQSGFDKNMRRSEFINLYLQGIFDDRLLNSNIDECCYSSFMNGFENYVFPKKITKKCDVGKNSFLLYFEAMYQRKDFEIGEDLRDALRKLSYKACPKIK